MAFITELPLRSSSLIRSNIKGFTFAMIWGVLVGTYSSIFIAAPLLNYLKVKRDWSVSSAVESTKNN